MPEIIDNWEEKFEEAIQEINGHIQNAVDILDELLPESFAGMHHETANMFVDLNTAWDMLGKVQSHMEDIKEKYFSWDEEEIDEEEDLDEDN